jgi:hypothetical protein
MERPPIPAPMPRPRKSGSGCLVQVLAVLVLGMVLMLAIYAIVAPLGFFMGGRFHIYPQWTGCGKLHSNAAGDYVLYVSISPTTRGRGGRGGPRVNGRAVLCTQRGEKYNLRVGGDFGKTSGTNLQGKTAALYAYNYSYFGGSNAPSLEFRGKWNNPDLVLDDQGSITRAFDPGGTLVTNSHMRPYKQEVVPLTLHEGSRADFDASLRAGLRREEGFVLIFTRC